MTLITVLPLFSPSNISVRNSLSSAVEYELPSLHIVCKLETLLQVTLVMKAIGDPLIFNPLEQ